MYEAILCSITTSLYSFQNVAIALLLTISTTLAIILYACNTKNNFAVCKIGLYAILSQMFTIYRNYLCFLGLKHYILFIFFFPLYKLVFI